MTQVWRLNIKTGSKRGTDERAFCFDNGILGVGWQVSLDEADWNTYEQAARSEIDAKHHRSLFAALKALRAMKINDLVWARGLDGVYRVARVTGGWQYSGAKAHRDADIANFRQCVWTTVGAEHLVPGKVASSFARGRTCQRVRGNGVRMLSEWTHDEVGSDPHQYNVKPKSVPLFELLDPTDCEDLVALYLQKERGYMMVSSTRRRGTPRYEFTLVHRETGTSAVAQVKNGTIDLTPSKYAGLADRAYLFTSRGTYEGNTPEGVELLDGEVLLQFARDFVQVLPERMRRLVAFSKGEA